MHFSHKPRHSRGASAAAMSLVELLIVIAVIGILAAIAVPNIGNVVLGSKRGVAENVVETLNKATRQFGHSQWDLRTDPVAGSGEDEMHLLRTLQWREPDASSGGELNPKGPFMRPDWSPSTSTSDEDFRAEWTGSSWKLVEPDETGVGLKLVFDGSDLGKPFVHPADFVPAGSR